MKNKITLLIASLFIFCSGFSQTNNFWKKKSETSAKSNQEKSTSASYSLDYNKLKEVLSKSPKMGEFSNNSELIVTFPNELGEFKEYKIIEKSNLHPDLEKRFPNIKSYSGISINGNSIHISLSPNEISGVIIGTDDAKNQFIRKQNNDNYYIITSKIEENPDEKFECGTRDNTSSTNNITNKKGRSAKTAQRNANDRTLRIYRLALASTAEFSNFYINRANVSNGTNQQKKAAVLAGFNTIITNINAIYERDLSVRFELIANNDNIIFLDTSTDGLTHDNSSTLINEAHGVITNAVGLTNFDIGHVLDLSNRGGFGALGVLCNDTNKGEGTSTALDPTGNFFEGLFLHELGHQLGAEHTFNNACNGNRVNTNAIEPGSGSSIMSYSGVCAPNVINVRDTYFHAKSIEQMWAVVSNSNCGTSLNTGNTAPTVNAGNDFTIPKSTPFVLKGTGSDANNPVNNLTYTWEQMDIGIEPISAYAVTSPIFRSRPPSPLSERYFPVISGVASGFTNFETLPAVSREMNFRLTVRDNHNGGASTASDDMKVTVNDSAGPFVVTSPNSNEVIWRTGTNQTITWDVAGTTGNGINATSVDILLSTDGGNTFNTTLASNTPNDGSHQITVPNNPGSLNRIMVRGTNHIFYDMSNESFFITDGSDTTRPNAPTGLTATAPDNNDNISATLNWTASTDNVGVVGYIIVQDGEEVFTWNNQSTSNLTMRGLEDGTQYSFQVIAFDAAGNKSIPSSTATITTSGNVPKAPKNVVASNITSTGFTLNWDASIPGTGRTIDGYSVLVNGIFKLYTKNVTPNNLTTAVLTDLDPGRTYSIEINAVDSNNTRARNNSTPIEVKTLPDNVNPSTPTNLTASAPQSTNDNPETSVDLNWTASTDNTRVDGYIIVQNGVRVFTWNNQTPAITMRGLSPGTQYTFQVIAFDAANRESGVSNSATITTQGQGPNDTTPPSDVSNLTVVNITQTTATLNWNPATDNVGVTGYDIYRGNDATAFDNSTTNSFNLTGLTPGSTTTYRIKAKDAAGNVSVNFSNTVTITTLSNPGGPNYCAAGNQGSNYIDTVSFNNVSNNPNSGNSPYSDFTSSVQAFSVARGQSLPLTVTPGIVATNWTQNVVAAWIDWNQDGTFSTAERVLLKTPGVGGQTTTVTVPNDAILGNTRLRVRYRWASNPNPCGTSANDGDEVEDYTVNVTDGNNNGDTTPPSDVSNLTVVNITQTTATLNWVAATDNVGVTGYDIYRGTETTAFDSSTTNSFNLTELTPNTTTTYRVKAKDAAGNVSANFSNTITVTTLDSGNVPTYCAAGNQGTNYIAQVSFNTINNPSQNNNYSDFTDQSTSVLRGQTLPLTVTPGITNTSWTQNVVAAWIDWNQDGTFSTTERVLLKTHGVGGQTTTVTVPNDAILGNTRLRVRYRWASNPNPCGTSANDGNEVEDYTINVTGGNNNGDTTPPSNVSNLTVVNITQTTADLSWTPATDNVAVTGYDIYRNSESTVFISTTTNSFQLTGLTAGTTTTYRVKAKDAAGNDSADFSDIVTVTTLPGNNTPTYCAAGRQNTNYISEVSFGSISNPNSDNRNYSDFTNMSTTVQRGQALPLTVTPGISFWNQNVVAGWIDWNQDGTFSTSERVLLKTPGTGGQTTTITVPNDAQLGSTRLRVRYKWASTPNPCGTASSDGDEVEDYTVIVTDGASASPGLLTENGNNNIEQEATIFPNPFNESFTLNVSPYSGTTFNLSIYDAAGRQIYSHEYEKNKVKLVNLGEHINIQGSYLIRIQSSKKTEILRVLKK